MPSQDLMGEVARLRSQNMSNEEIAQRLLYKGYSNAEVFDALSNADATAAYEGAQMDYGEESQPVQPSFTFQQSMSAPPAMPSMEHGIDSSKIAEIAESIIEDKWSDLVDHVNRIIEWKSSMELRLNSMEEQIKGMKSDFDTLHKSILGRITDSDTVMREVSTDIKALEQVFKKILPGFVENVNELSRITQRMKK
jgi:hypothetical protein